MKRTLTPVLASLLVAGLLGTQAHAQMSLPMPSGEGIAVLVIGEATAPPDLAVIGFNVKETGGSLANAYEAAQAEADSIAEALHGAGVGKDEVEIDGPTFVLTAGLAAMMPFPQPKKKKDGQVPEAADYTATATVTGRLKLDPKNTKASVQAVSDVVASLRDRLLVPTQVTFDVQNRVPLEKAAYADAVAKAKIAAVGLSASTPGLPLGLPVGVQSYDFGKMMQSMMGGMFGGGMMGQMMKGMFGGGGSGSGNTKAVKVERMLIVNFGKGK